MATSLKQLVSTHVFGADERAQQRNRFWVYIGFSLVFLALLLTLSIINRGA